MFLKPVALLTLSTIIIFSASAFAFSGSGKRRDHQHEWYRAGVDSIGVHVNGDGDADVIICQDDEDLVDDKCLKKCDENLERNADGTCTICTNGNVYLSYMEDPCATETAHKGDPNMECVSNRDCADNEFCALTTTQSSCYDSVCVPTNGICTPVVAQEIPEINTSIYPERSFTATTTNNLSRWSAENFCKAQNKHLIKASDFNFQMKENCYDSPHYISGTLEDWSYLREVLQSHLILMNDHCKTSEGIHIPYHMDLDEQTMYFDAYGQEYTGYALCK